MTKACRELIFTVQVNCEPGQDIVVKADQFRLDARSRYVQIVLEEVAGIGTIKSLSVETEGVSVTPVFFLSPLTCLAPAEEAQGVILNPLCEEGP